MAPALFWVCPCLVSGQVLVEPGAGFAEATEEEADPAVEEAIEEEVEEVTGTGEAGRLSEEGFVSSPDPFATFEGAGVGDPLAGSGMDSTDLPGLKVDVNGSGSYIYDSNTAQTPDGPSANLFAFAYGLDVKSGAQSNRGGYYGFNLRGQYFVYDDPAAQMGRDPYEQFFAGYVGANGGFTRVKLDVDYHRSNGNSLDWNSVQRETRRTPSHDYNIDLSVSRDLFRGTLELGTGYMLRDFDAGSGIGDGRNVYGDIGWMMTPSFAPKSDMGLGVRFGSDEYDGQPKQDFFTPSYRWKYRLSGKTSIRNSLGYETRSSGVAGAANSGNFVFDGGVEWAATAKTGVGLSYYRRIQPSYILNGQDTTSTGIDLAVTNKLPGRFLLSSRVGYEDASYFSTAPSAAAANRDDAFLRVAFDLSHPLQITEKLRGEWSIFFHFNQDDSTIAQYSFEQNVAGLRVGLVY